MEAFLPKALHSSLFLDPPALYPVCRLLQGVNHFEEARLQTVRRHAAGGWSLTKPSHAPLTDLDVVTIIGRRLERLKLLSNELNGYARCQRAVPTALAAPLLDKLRVEAEQLEKVLEADIAPRTDQALPLWWLASLISAEHRRLRAELDAVQALIRRIQAVKFTSLEFAARGQAGVAQGLPEERALRRSLSGDVPLSGLATRHKSA